MARTIEIIYNEIVAEKENQTSLDGLLPASESYTNLLDQLTSTSKVAIWRLWAYMMSVAIHIHELYFDLFKTEVEGIAANAPAGTPGWYQKLILTFQYGHSLVYANHQYAYAVVDESAQIIKYCAIEERSDGVVIAKVAKETSGEPAPLVSAEKSAVESYLSKLKFAGTRVAVSSGNADQFTPNYNVYYDPLIPLLTIQNNIQIAIDDYRKNLGFNGLIRITKLTDIIQSVEGVIDPVFQSASIIPDGGSLIDVQVTATPAAGHFDYTGTVVNLFTFIQDL